MSGRLLWDVDTQVDFVHADGKLPVPGAESAAPAMARLVRQAEDEGVTHLATADDHGSRIRDHRRSGLRHDLAALPAGRAGRGEDPRDRAARPVPGLAHAVSARPGARARAWPPSCSS